MRQFTRQLLQWRVWVWIGIALVVGALPYRMMTQKAKARTRRLAASVAAIHPIRVANQSFHYINPLLGYDVPERKNIPPFRAIHAAASVAVADAQQRHAVSIASAYYRDLATGAWFAINDEEHYAPASLAKVPLLIAYLKMAETIPGLLDRTIRFQRHSTDTPEQTFAPVEQLTLGRAYTIAELLRAMIVASDNDAAFLLYRAADDRAVRAAYADLGLPSPTTDDASDTTTVDAYARFFRFLYNSTYLTEERSEYALQLLAQTSFNRGLVAGTPGQLPIAHKFGERTVPATTPNAPTAELHDCGIVYHPQRPYVLCIMTKGADFDALATTIQHIAAAVAIAVQHLAETPTPSDAP